MKKLLIIIALLFASVQLRASHRASELHLRMFDFSLFTISIDDRSFTTPVTKFHLNDLNPGTHFITITRHSDGELGHYIHPHHVFSGYVHIPFGSRVNASIDRKFRFRINKVTPLIVTPVVHANPIYFAPDFAPVHIAHGMNEFDFRRLISTIDRLSFESSRMQVARQALSANLFTSQQVATLVGLMTFESTKLELAKIAFHKTVDQQNYFIINDMFTFESSIRELNSFIFRT